MLSLDLFDSKFEKQLHEGAVDDAEYARLKTLGEKIDYLKQARAKSTDPEMRRAIDDRIKQYDDERHEILSVRGMKEAEQQQRSPAKGLLKGKDLITPQQRVTGATPQKSGVMGAVKDVVGGIKRFVKGEPDQGPTFEADTAPGQPFELTSQEPQSSPQAIYQQLITAYKAEVPYVVIPFIEDEQNATLTKQGIFNALVAIRMINQKNRRAYIEKNFKDFESFMNFVGRLRPYQYRRPPKAYRTSQPAPVQPTVSTTAQPDVAQNTNQQQTAPSGPLVDPEFRKDMGLSERKSQKKKSKETGALDTRLNREIQKARAKYPTAQSDLEALSLDQMTVNDQQDSVIQNLNQELNQVKNQNQALSQTLQNLNTRVAGLKAPAPTTPVAKEPAPATTAKPSPAVPSITISTGEKVPLPGDVAAKDQEARQQIQQLNKQIQQLELMLTLKQPAGQQTDLQNQIEKLSATITDLENERKIRIEKQRKAAERAASTRASKKAAQDQVDALIGRIQKSTKGTGTEEPLDQPEDELDVLTPGNVVPIKRARKAAVADKKQRAVAEHGGGIGPRQHWQSLMRNEGWSDKYNPTPYAVYIDGREWKVFSSDEHARDVANKVIANLKRQGRDQKVTIGPSQAWLKGESVKESNDTKLKLAAEEFIKGIYDQSGPVYKAYYKSFQQGQAVENQLRKEIAKKYAVSEKDLSDAETRHRASRLAGSGRNKDLEETFAMPGTTIPRKSVIQGYTVFFNPETRMVSVTRGGDSEEAAIEQARIGTANIKTFRNAAEKLIDRIEDQIINEGVRDTASATAVIACLLTGGSLTGCATAPQQTTAQQVLKTGQDIGRTVQTAQKITRAGVEAEVNQEIRNLLRGIGGRPEELNHSNILRIWRKIKGQPPVQPEPQAPEYGPAEPVKRTPQYEAKEIHTREDFIKERDRLLRMISMETEPANKQILRSAIRQLESRAENEGWISLQQRMIREDNYSGAAEEAILKRIMVSHRDLLQQYGPQKVMQAAEEVAYNVGDLGEIGSSDVSGWVKQVRQILGATA